MTDDLRAACEKLDSEVAQAAAKARTATRSMIDASLDVARAGRRASTGSMKAVRPEEFGDLTARFTALRSG